MTQITFPVIFSDSEIIWTLSHPKDWFVVTRFPPKRSLYSSQHFFFIGFAIFYIVLFSTCEDYIIFQLLYKWLNCNLTITILPNSVFYFLGNPWISHASPTVKMGMQPRKTARKLSRGGCLSNRDSVMNEVSIVFTRLPYVIVFKKLCSFLERKVEFSNNTFFAICFMGYEALWEREFLARFITWPACICGKAGFI
jgi:hypothetical protein